MKENDTPESRNPSADASRLRRRIIIIFVCMVVFVLVTVPLIKLLDARNGEGDNATQATLPPANLFWESADFEYDIMKDKEYLALNRQIMFEDTVTGVTEVMDAASRGAHGEAAAVLYDMINLIIRGDTDGYNRLFSKAYYKDDNEELAPFTMQQVYDIKIKSMGTERDASGTHTVYKFYVDYKIHKNNGTFRQDIGDDESLTQVFTLSDKEGTVRIDGIGYINRK